MTIEQEIRLLLLTSSYVLNDEPTKENVLNQIEDEKWASFSERDLRTKDNRNELVWRNSFAFVRLRLVRDGSYSNVKRNCWAITEEGKQEMIQLCKMCLGENEFSYISHLGKEKIKEIHTSIVLKK